MDHYDVNTQDEDQAFAEYDLEVEEIEWFDGSASESSTASV
jgi:hypothetical protein